ncbi:MAG: hypothetical protein NVSMB8_08940 [Candidatus Limnocylindrales bacterium]
MERDAVERARAGGVMRLPGPVVEGGGRRDLHLVALREAVGDNAGVTLGSAPDRIAPRYLADLP